MSTYPFAKRNAAESGATRVATGEVAFIDFEASGLGAQSWPVEVGWAFVGGASECTLIKPAADWPMSAWDPAAEKLHGIAIDVLRAEGAEPAAVCRRLNAVLGGASVYADAPAWDGFWLYRLFSAARIKPAFELADFGALMRPLVGDGEEALFQEAEAIAPRRHRAAADALHLRTLYDLATSR